MARQSNIDREITRIQREEALLEASLHPQPSRAQLKTEREMNYLLDKWVRKSGLDMQALKALTIEREREMDRSAKKVERLVSRHGVALHKDTVNHAKALRAQARPSAGPLPADATIVLDTAHSISAFREPRVLKDFTISPGNNFAKVLLDRRGTFSHLIDRVNFTFIWRNTNEDAVIVDASADLTATGTMGIHVGNAWTVVNVGTIEVGTHMSLRRFPLPFAGKSSYQYIQALIAYNNLLLPEIKSDIAVDATRNLSVQGFLLAGGATLMVTVTLTIDCDFRDGRGVANFSGRSGRVTVPQVTLGVTSAVQNVFVAKK